MKKALIFLVVIIAVLGVFVLTKRTTTAPTNDSIETGAPSDTTEPTTPPAGTPTPTPSPADTSTATQGMTVTYGPKGFDPKSITIKSGETVTFVNESESGMWVASSKHPTHADYPEKTDKDCLGSTFDECVSVGTGGSYSFTFKKTGTWNYHNHVAPSDWGTVVVE